MAVSLDPGMSRPRSTKRLPSESPDRLLADHLPTVVVVDLTTGASAEGSPPEPHSNFQLGSERLLTDFEPKIGEGLIPEAGCLHPMRDAHQGRYPVVPAGVGLSTALETSGDVTNDDLGIGHYGARWVGDQSLNHRR